MSNFANNVIVIGGCNHHNTLSVVRCIGEAGCYVELLCHGGKWGCAAGSKYIKRVRTYESEDDFMNQLRNASNVGTGRYILLSCDDTASHLLDIHYEELKDKYCFFNAGVEGKVSYYQDKNVQVSLAESVGAMVPASKVYSGEGRAKFEKFPCLVKPQESTNGGKKILICNSQQELDRKIQSFADGKHVLIQQYLTKDYEIVVLGLSFHGKVAVPGFIRKIRDNKGGTTYSQVFPISELDSEIVNHSKSMIQEIGYEGLFGIEFIHNDDGYWFIEANLRNDATCYALAKAGANLPALYVRAALGECLEGLINYAEVKPIHAMVELKDFKFVLKRKVTLVEWLKQLYSAECRYYYSRMDKKPLLYAILSILANCFKKINIR